MQMQSGPSVVPPGLRPWIVVVLMGGTGRSPAADWVQWRGPNRDGHVPTAPRLPTILPAGVEPRWRIRVGEGFSSPVVSGGKSAGKVFYLDLQNGQEVVHAVEADTGRELWHSPLDTVFKWRVPLNTRLGRHVITPVVADDLVIVGSYQLGLVAVRVTVEGADFKAQPAWTRKELAPNFASPVATDDYVYGVGSRSSVYCAEASTGQVAWSQTGLIRGAGEQAYATFLVMGKNILMLSDSGELILFAAHPGGFEVAGRMQACGLTWCSPAYADGRLYLRDAEHLFCLDLAP